MMRGQFRRFLAAASALVLLPAWSAAQEQAAINGRVTSEAGQPLPAAQVFIEGLNLGAQTNAEGRYNIIVPAARVQGQQVTLSVRLIGYRSQSSQVTLSPGTITRDFVLALNPLRLGEVVSTGAGLVTTQEKLGNTVNSVRAEEIVRANEPNIISAIAGKAPNVEVNLSAGDPGASASIRIRGTKTIQGTGQPLIVVDGTPIDNTTVSTGTVASYGSGNLASAAAPNRASDINPNDIESVEILKGSAAAAIYGARAGQGVVLITTKSGRPGATRVSLRSTMTVDELNKAVPLQRRFAQGTGGVTSTCTAVGCRLAAGSFGAELPAGTRTYDHARDLFNNGHMFDNTLSISGGNDRTTFYLSAGQMSHEGMIFADNDWYDRTTVRLKASHRLLDNLNVGGNASYVDARGEFIQKGSNTSGLMLGSLRTPPEFNNRVYIDTTTGLHRSYRYPRPTAASLNEGRGYDNPFFVAAEDINESKLGRVYGNVNVEYDPLEWVAVRWTMGGDYSSDVRVEALRQSSSSFPTGAMVRADFVNYQIDHNLTVTGTRTFSPDFAGSLTLGQNLNSRNFRQYAVTGTNFIAPDVIQLDNTTDWTPDEYEYLTHSESYFGQVTADLYNQLYLTAALRNDGFSTFGESDPRAWYPKASLAWTFTEATGQIPFVTFGKLRAAYGETGTEPAPYQTITAYTTANFVEGWGPFLSPTIAGNGGLSTSFLKGQTDLKPERTREYETGLDVGLLDDRADMGITFYSSKSEDVIFSIPLPPSTGFQNQAQNGATIQNRGLELTLNVRPLTRPNFNWELGFNWAKNVNKVLSLSGADFADLPGEFGRGGGYFDGNEFSAVQGSRVGVMRGFDFVRCGRGLTVDGVDIDADCGGAPSGALYIGADGFPMLDETPRVIGDPHPDWTGSVRTAMTFFKKWQLSGLLDIKEGGDIWNGTKGALYNFGTHKDTEVRGQALVFGESWQPQEVAGPGAGTPVVIDESWFTGLGSGFGDVAAQFVEDGSFVKLREISLSYTADQPWVTRMTGLSSVDLRVAGRNLKTWTDYSGVDPDTQLAGAETMTRGVDYFNNPNTRSFVFTVGLNR